MKKKITILLFLFIPISAQADIYICEEVNSTWLTPSEVDSTALDEKSTLIVDSNSGFKFEGPGNLYFGACDVSVANGRPHLELVCDNINFDPQSISFFKRIAISSSLSFTYVEQHVDYTITIAGTCSKG
jgi:hypothetical protein